MKKWIACILTLYIFFIAIIPCSIFDKCEEDQLIEQSSNKVPKRDCNDCSPFSICSPSYGFTVNTINTSVAPVEFNNLLLYSDYYLSFTSEYYSSFFQPPRKG